MTVPSGFYLDQVIAPLSTTHQKFLWPYPALDIIISNDENTGSKKIYWSYSDPKLDGTLGAGQQFEFKGSQAGTIWLWCDGAGAPNYRFWALGV